MANYAVRIVAEKIDLENDNRVVDRDELSSISIKAPKNIIDLGLRHGEQIALLQ